MSKRLRNETPGSGVSSGATIPLPEVVLNEPNPAFPTGQSLSQLQTVIGGSVTSYAGLLKVAAPDTTPSGSGGLITYAVPGVDYSRWTAVPVSWQWNATTPATTGPLSVVPTVYATTALTTITPPGTVPSQDMPLAFFIPCGTPAVDNIATFTEAVSYVVTFTTPGTPSDGLTITHYSSNGTQSSGNFSIGFVLYA